MKRFLSLFLTAMMVLSCVSFTAFAAEGDAPAFGIYNGASTLECLNAVAGTKVLLTVPADGAVYYNNGVEIATTPGIVAGTVAVPVNGGANRYTAVAGGVTYGPATIYGFIPVNDSVIGATLGKTAASDKRVVGTDSVLLEANPEGLTNLIDADHPYVYKVGSTDTAVKHKFSSGMKSRSHYAVAYGFYVDGVLAEGEDFRL